LILILSGYFIILKLIKPEEPFEKSIAVLPFNDYSEKQDQEYFSNGITEEIINQLSKIKDLEVIWRTSSMSYKDTKLDVKDIAHELGVSKIVEGSVQKASTRVRITVKLIDGKTGKYEWSETYDRELTDLFAVQTEISINIARKLDAILTNQEESMIKEIPTKNLMAYDYLLKGRQYGADFKWNSAIEMYTKAIELDPRFTLAYIERASKYSSIFFTKGDYYTGDFRNFDQLARADLATAIKLNPNFPEVKLEESEQLYRFDRDHDKALKILDEISHLMTNNYSYHYLRGSILRRKGNWKESIKDHLKAIQLDPLNLDTYNQIAYSYRLTRSYSEAAEYFNKFHSYEIPISIKNDIFMTILEWKGDLKEALKVSGSTVDELGSTGYFMDNYSYYDRQYDKLFTTATKFESQFTYFPKSLNQAFALYLKSDEKKCKQYADSVISELEILIKQFPKDDRYYSALGLAYAFIGENKRAIECAQKAVRLKPIKIDAWQGYEKEKDLTRIYVFTGNYEQAMDKIEYLLTIPGDLSVPLLKIDPAYDKLQNTPRFKKILTKEYRTMY
jgi:TolB-like protein